MKKVILAVTLAVILVVGIGAVAVAATPPGDSPKGLWETINNKLDIVISSIGNMWDTKFEQSDGVVWEEGKSGSMAFIFSPENSKSHISLTVGIDGFTAGDLVNVWVRLDDSANKYLLATIDTEGAYNFEFDAQSAYLEVKNLDLNGPLNVEFVATMDHY